MSLIQEVRKTDTVPIIVLSARSNERDKVEALDLGANDYITKPLARRNCWLVSVPFSAAIGTAKRRKVPMVGNSACRIC